jgi:hypothetical protein
MAAISIETTDKYVCYSNGLLAETLLLIIEKFMTKWSRLAIMSGQFLECLKHSNTRPFVGYYIGYSHYNTGTEKVRYSNVSGIRMFLVFECFQYSGVRLS